MAKSRQIDTGHAMLKNPNFGQHPDHRL